MSYYELEYLVELSIKELDACITDKSVDLRTIFFQLYQWQQQWDTKFTHFRVIDILVKHHFAYPMDMSEHPKYNDHKSLLDQFVKDAVQTRRPDHYPVCFLHFVDPTRDLREETKDLSITERNQWYQDNPMASYYRYPYLYADAGSPLWEALVESGQLSDEDAKTPEPTLSLIDIGLMVVQCAEKQEHFDAIAYWYICLPMHLIAHDKSTFADDPALSELIAIVNRSGALSKTPYIERYLQLLGSAESAEVYLEKVYSMQD